MRVVPYLVTFLVGLNVSIMGDWLDDIPRRIHGCWSAQCSWSPFFAWDTWLISLSMLTWIVVILYFRGADVE